MWRARELIRRACRIRMEMERPRAKGDPCDGALGRPCTRQTVDLQRRCRVGSDHRLRSLAADPFWLLVTAGDLPVRFFSLDATKQTTRPTMFTGTMTPCLLRMRITEIATVQYLMQIWLGLWVDEKLRFALSSSFYIRQFGRIRSRRPKISAMFLDNVRCPAAAFAVETR